MCSTNNQTHPTPSIWLWWIVTDCRLLTFYTRPRFTNNYETFYFTFAIILSRGCFLLHASSRCSLSFFWIFIVLFSLYLARFSSVNQRSKLWLQLLQCMQKRVRFSYIINSRFQSYSFIWFQLNFNYLYNYLLLFFEDNAPLIYTTSSDPIARMVGQCSVRCKHFLMLINFIKEQHTSNKRKYYYPTNY